MTKVGTTKDMSRLHRMERKFFMQLEEIEKSLLEPGISPKKRKELLAQRTKLAANFRIFTERVHGMLNEQ